MKKMLLPLLGVAFGISAATAQLVNDGATIIVENGATLVVESDIQNNAGSTITNNGTIEVKGDFENLATLTSTDPASLVKFTGSGDSEFTSNGAELYHLQINKTSGKVILQDDAAVSNMLTLDDGVVELGDHDLTIGESGATANASTDSYVDASGAGFMKKEMTGPGAFTFPVGDDNEYSRLESVMTSGSYMADAAMAVSVVDDTLDVQPVDATDYISRYWNVELENISGATENTLTGHYTAADLAGSSAMAANVNGFSHTVANGLDFTNSAGNAGAMTVTSRVDGQASADFSGSNKYGSIDLAVFLQGALSGASMSTAINGLLPLTSPYTSGEVVESIPSADIVDWIEIEVRDAGDNSNVLSTHSAFLKSNGEVVGLSGSGDVLLKDAPASAFIAVRHRNHLGVMASGTSNLDGSASIDFTDPNTSTFGTDAQALVGSVHAMRGGDVNGDGFVYYQGGGNDRSAILALLAGNQFGFITTYSPGDVNFDSFSYYQGGGNDRSAILSILSGNQFGFFQQQLP